MNARPKRPAEPVSSRKRLLETAKRLMAEQGYERVSTAVIAREAGTSESQLVRYFGSKAGLLKTIFDESWEPLTPQLARLVASATTAREAIATLLATMVNLFDRDPNLAKLFLFEGRRVRGDSAEVVLSEGFSDFFKLVVSLIERGQKDGSFNTTLASGAMASALVGSVEGMMRDRLLAFQRRQPAPFPASQILAVFSALIAGLGQKAR